MGEDTRDRRNYLARDIKLGVSMESTMEGSSRETKSTRKALKQAMYDEMREMVKARRESLRLRSQ
jgi:hypothetical protein